MNIYMNEYYNIEKYTIDTNKYIIGSVYFLEKVLIKLNIILIDKKPLAYFIYLLSNGIESTKINGDVENYRSEIEKIGNEVLKLIKNGEVLYSS